MKRERLIVLVKASLGIFGIWLLIASGLLSIMRRDPTNAAWIVFDNATNETATTLYRMRPDGTGLQKIAEDEFLNPRSLSVSPDGRWIAYLSDNFTNESFSLHVIRADGSRRTTLADNVQWDFRNRWPFSWSPDSDWIAYWTLDSGSWVVNQIRADGSDHHVITQDIYAPKNLYWLRGGQALLLPQEFEHGEFALFSVSIAAPNRQRIADSQERLSQLNATPDGEWVVYQTYSADGWNIYRVRADGSGEEKVWGTRWATYIGNLEWSPTGEWISFTTYPAEDTCVHYRIRSDGRDLELITEACVSPIWSADGNALLFRDFRAGSYAVLRLNVEDRAIERLSPTGFGVGAFTQTGLIDLVFGGTKLVVFGIIFTCLSIFYNFLTKRYKSIFRLPI